MAINLGTKFTITTQDLMLQSKWSKDFQLAREKRLVFGKLVRRYDVSNCDELIIPKVSNLADPAAITADGDLSDVTPDTEGAVTLLLDKKFGYILNFPDEVSLKTQYEWMKAYTEKAAFGCANKVDSDLAALCSLVTFSTKVKSYILF